MEADRWYLCVDARLENWHVNLKTCHAKRLISMIALVMNKKGFDFEAQAKNLRRLWVNTDVQSDSLANF